MFIVTSLDIHERNFCYTTEVYPTTKTPDMRDRASRLPAVLFEQEKLLKIGVKGQNFEDLKFYNTFRKYLENDESQPSGLRRRMRYYFNVLWL